jgi:plastocyanin
MKRLLVTITGLAALALVAGAVAATAPANKATVLIRHQVQHCHAWSFDSGKFVANATGTIARGGAVIFTNNDVMSHELIQKSGPAARFEGNPLMGRMGATFVVVFPKAGTYTFGTKPGEDYFKGVKTIGADNVLTLKIVVR